MVYRFKGVMMKRFITLLLLGISTSMVLAEEDYGVNVPEWKDFAPPSYIDVKAPKGLGKLNINTRYWYERKIEFETELETCKSLEANDERFNCYETLKVKQYKLNNDYNARLESQISERSQIPGMNSTTDNMFPIGGYLDQMTKFMPNEMR